jgi:hypothetical protein
MVVMEAATPQSARVAGGIVEVVYHPSGRAVGRRGVWGGFLFILYLFFVFVSFFYFFLFILLSFSFLFLFLF